MNFEHKFLEKQNVYHYMEYSDKSRYGRLLEPAWYKKFVYPLGDDKEWLKLIENSFQTRDDYLTWVKEWKECYHWLVGEIRHAKRNRRGSPRDTTYDMSMWQHKARKGRDLANRMLKIRKLAKKMSFEMKQENIKVVV